jgi:hypothetical protein
MSQMSLVDVLREEADTFPPDLDPQFVENVLTEPQANTLAQAVTSDAVEAAPIVGDLLAVQRLEEAEERGVDYPNAPVFAQDTVGDLPTPFDLLGEALLVYHTPHYLEREYGIEVRTPAQDAIEALAEDLSGLADGR